MNGPLRVALALLLVVAPAAAAVPLAGAPSAPSVADGAMPTAQADGGATPNGLPPVVPAANTSAYLALPDDRMQTVRFGTVTLDVGGALSRDTTKLHGRYTTAQLREAFAAAGDDTVERRAVVNRTADNLDQRIADLAARERAALEAYNDGELSTRAYLRELATIHAAAESLGSTIDQLYTFDRASGMPVAVTRIARMKARLIPLTGPVRNQVARAMTGDASAPMRVYVETSDSGFVLSMVQEGQFDTQYVREAYFGDGLDSQWVDKPISIDEFERRLDELYPWVSENKDSSDSALTGEPNYLRSGVYAIAYNHPHGTVSNRDLAVYYDAGTQAVFFETQQLDVSQLPTTELANETDEDLRVVLRGTHADGPMAVTVVDATTGEPVDATVAVGGEPVGRTDGDRLWTVAPRGTFSVTASARGANVSVTVPNFA
ncbi:DUF7096 domain-containing protein [Halorarius litoreus]|uniref:DUF7096 domain-containing protein n=1 Tax=Halorarius litoreus TaxID=2962676 RepID=UPI0020CCB068|nr:hypothetical protein [Halorarius litoreus]